MLTQIIKYSGDNGGISSYARHSVLNENYFNNTYLLSLLLLDIDKTNYYSLRNKKNL